MWVGSRFSIFAVLGADFEKQTFHNNFNIRFALCEGKKVNDVCDEKGELRKRKKNLDDRKKK